MERVLGIPLHGVAADDIAGVERGAVVEAHALPERAGPDQQVRVGIAALGQGGDRRGAGRVVAVQALTELRADERRDGVGLVGAVQAARFAGRQPDELAPVAGDHRREPFQPER